ncbi:hypothetical protein Hanom_Chr07g00590201 [Helianthus anomalus]
MYDCYLNFFANCRVNSLMFSYLCYVYSGQNCQFSDKGSTQMPHNVLRPIGRSDGAPVTYPMSFQEPFFTYGK